MYYILKNYRARHFTTVLLAIGLSLLSLAVAAADEAATLQQRGIERIEAYIAHVRKTGDNKALFPELDQADEELRVSAERFAERGEWAAALFLGEKFWLSYAPSATILAGMKPVGPITEGRLLAAYNPGIGANQGDQGEITTITALYPDRNEVIENPTKAAIRRQVAGTDLVHLSVHGRFKANESLLSYLQLKPEGADDGKLIAAEMFGLPLDKTRLMVLSACETGESTVTNANETLGMIRALLYAGANTLILSWWEVEAQSTALWMETFHRTIRTAPATEAARQALLAVKAKPEYRHPYYWAAFQLVGR
jgi:hypothetical protein